VVPVILAVWLLALPFRILARLGLRGTVVLACLLVLAVTGYGMAADLGLLDPPAQARPQAGAAGPPPSPTARADLPPGWLGLYRTGARHCPGLSWTVLAGIGKVESNHGRGWPPAWANTPGVRSGWNHAGAAGPMQFGIGKGRAGNAWARFGRDYNHDGRVSVYDPGDAIPAAARYLCDAGAPHRLDTALYAYNHSTSYVASVKAIARRYRGGGRR
jgi:hypothetical protein